MYKTVAGKDWYLVMNVKKVASTSHDHSIILSSKNEEESWEKATMSSFIDFIDLSSGGHVLSNRMNQSNHDHLDISPNFQ